MKKAGLGAKRLTKRRINKDILELKNFKNELRSIKDIAQLLQEKLTTNEQSEWLNADVLYFTETQKRKRMNMDNKASKYKKYLVIMRTRAQTSNGKPDSSFLLLLSTKENDVEVKSQYDLNTLRAIDFGSDDNEFVMSVDVTGEQSVFLASTEERDEAIWIILQVSKAIVRHEIAVGYSVDLEDIGFRATAGGALSRFPPLQTLVSGGEGLSHMSGDLFGDEEADAEHLLDDLNWNVSAGGDSRDAGGPAHSQSDLHALLASQSDQLSCEIIDFLLQWEEMDDLAGSAPPVTKAKLPVAAATKPQNPFHTTASPAANPATLHSNGVRDTREVLTALALVDSELKAVDSWLGEQVGRLAEIQANLRAIEEESSGLETSWQNLHSVQQAVGAVVSGYSLSELHQSLILQTPGVYFSALLRPTSRGLDSVGALVKPLVGALSALRGALDTKAAGRATSAKSPRAPPEDTKTTDSALTSAQWKQLQTIGAVTAQRARLTELADTFCSNYGEFMLGLFELLLRHRALTEGDPPTVVKHFSLQPLIERHVHRVDRSDRLVPQHNQFLLAQKRYHGELNNFAQLLDLFCELSPNYARPLGEAHARAAQEHLYRPLAKTLFRDLQAAVVAPPKTHKLALATCARHHIADAGTLGQTFRSAHLQQRAGAPQAVAEGGLSSWMAVKVALLVLGPVMEAEEAFLKNTFHLEARPSVLAAPLQNSKISGPPEKTPFTESRLGSLLEAAFDGITARFETSMLRCAAGGIASSGEGSGADGAEIVAMLTVLHQFVDAYPTLSPVSACGAGIICGSDTNVTATSVNADKRSSLYLSRALGQFKTSLLARLSGFTSEQVAWVNAQRCDPKSPSVLAPFTKFPAFIVQIHEMTDGLHLQHADDLLRRLAKELLAWLEAAAAQSDKYADKVKMVNYSFFELALRPLVGAGCLQEFVAFAAQQRVESTARYVAWMVSYEFPALSALAVRMDGLGDRVSEQELSLYIRRKDVLNVVKEVETERALEASVHSLRRRLEKHFSSEHDAELELIAGSWQLIKQRVVRILSRMEEAASASYQIQLEVGPRAARDIFDRVSGGAQGGAVSAAATERKLSANASESDTGKS